MAPLTADNTAARAGYRADIQGLLIALLMRGPWPRAVQQAAGGVGLAGIIVSSFLFTGYMPYLWHWPLLVIARCIHGQTAASAASAALAVSCAVAVAAVSRRFADGAVEFGKAHRWFAAPDAIGTVALIGEWLRMIDGVKPQVVIVVHRSTVDVDVDVEGALRFNAGYASRHHVVDDPAEKQRRWGSGVDAMLGELASRSVRVIWVEVGPEFPLQFEHQLPSLLRLVRPIGVVSRAELDARRRSIRAAEAPVLAKYAAIVDVMDPTDVLCDACECRSTINGQRAFYDDDHINVFGSRLLKDLYVEHLQRAYRQP